MEYYLLFNINHRPATKTHCSVSVKCYSKIRKPMKMSTSASKKEHLLKELRPVVSFLDYEIIRKLCELLLIVIKQKLKKYLILYKNNNFRTCFSMQNLYIRPYFNLSIKIRGHPGVNKFFSGLLTFWTHKLTCAPDRARKKMHTQNQNVRPIKTHLKTLSFVIYYLNSTCRFHF